MSRSFRRSLSNDDSYKNENSFHDLVQRLLEFDTDQLALDDRHCDETVAKLQEYCERLTTSVKNINENARMDGTWFLKAECQEKYCDYEDLCDGCYSSNDTFSGDARLSFCGLDDASFMDDQNEFEEIELQSDKTDAILVYVGSVCQVGYKEQRYEEGDFAVRLCIEYDNEADTVKGKLQVEGCASREYTFADNERQYANTERTVFKTYNFIGRRATREELTR